MAMISLVCPKCGGVAKLSLVDANYSGPRRCWKCHEMFTINIVNSQVTSCEPLSQEEFDRQQAQKKAEEKARGGGGGGGIEMSRQEKLDFSQGQADKPRGGVEFGAPEKAEVSGKPMDDLWSNLKSNVKKEPVRQAENPGTPGAVFPPEKVNTFIPVDGVPKTPEKQPKTLKQDYSIPVSQKDPAGKADPNKPVVFPPERIRTFVPLEEPDEDKKKK